MSKETSAARDGNAEASPEATGGKLVLVATPIGNLGDLSERAAETMAAADLLCCEDTRHTGLLLSRLGIRAPRLVSLNAHNEGARSGELVAMILSGATVALVSDAGTPAISDPGERLVEAAVAAGCRVTTVPGPSAVLAAVVVAGFGARRFAYEGFLPRRGAERRDRIGEIAASRCPCVIFEAPSRVAATLLDLEKACGPERRVALCRELTKLHEEIWRGGLGECAARAALVAGTTGGKGEHVIVVDGACEGAAVDHDSLAAAVAKEMEAGLGRRDAALSVSRKLGVSKRLAYESSLSTSRPPGTPASRRGGVPGDR